MKPENIYLQYLYVVITCTYNSLKVQGDLGINYPNSNSVLLPPPVIHVDFGEKNEGQTIKSASLTHHVGRRIYSLFSVAVWEFVVFAKE